MPRVSVILNPHAGRGRGAKVHSLIKEAIPEASVLQTRFAGEAEALACQAARDGADIVVAAGGDGTLCEVLNGIWPHRKRLKLAVLPIGTGNDFARTLGIGTDFPKAIEVIRAGHCQRVDVGRVAIGEGEKQSQFFINVCGTGFDALVATRINSASSHPVLRYLKGTVAYLWAVLSELIRLQSRELTICIDGQVICEKAVLCAIANAKSYGECW
jgi:diacylglycerol kinase (ATP)